MGKLSERVDATGYGLVQGRGAGAAARPAASFTTTLTTTWDVVVRRLSRWTVVEKPQLLDERLRQLPVLDEVYAEALLASVLEGRADVVRGLAVENEEAVVERPGMEDRGGRVLRVEHVDVVLREPVAGGVGGRRDAHALALLREDVEGMDVDAAIHKDDLALGAAHEVDEQTEDVEHLPG